MRIHPKHTRRAALLTLHASHEGPIPPDELGRFRRMSLAGPHAYLTGVQAIDEIDNALDRLNA